jgi:hypothetical protein
MDGLRLSQVARFDPHAKTRAIQIIPLQNSLTNSKLYRPRRKAVTLRANLNPICKAVCIPCRSTHTHTSCNHDGAGAAAAAAAAAAPGLGRSSRPASSCS